MASAMSFLVIGEITLRAETKLLPSTTPGIQRMML